MPRADTLDTSREVSVTPTPQGSRQAFTNPAPLLGIPQRGEIQGCTVTADVSAHLTSVVPHPTLADGANYPCCAGATPGAALPLTNRRGLVGPREWIA